MRKLLIIFIIGVLFVPNVFAVWDIFSPETPPPLIVRFFFGTPWFETNGNNITFNESYFNISVAGLINDTHIEGTGPWLYDNFFNMFFNETKLNETIDDRIILNNTDTQKQGAGYLYNDSTTIYLNGTLLNQTIDARDTLKNLSCTDGQVAKWDNTTLIWKCANDNYEPNTDTHVQGDRIYLYNDSITMYLNETKLNETINITIQNNSLWIIGENNDVVLKNPRNINASDMNITDVDVLFAHNLSGRSPIGILNESGNLIAQFSNTQYPQFGDDYGDLVLRTVTVDRLLITGLLNYSATEPPDVWNADEVWINENNFTFYFNETKLNQTISLQVNSSINETRIWIQNSSGIYQYLPPANVFINGSLYVDGSGFFGNNSVYIGGIKMSESDPGVLNVSGFTYALRFIGEGSRLFNLSINETNGSLTVNGPLIVKGNLNMTNYNITDLDCMFFSDGTIQCTAATQKQADGIYLYNDSTTIYFNGTLLNETISSLNKNTEKQGAGYLYNDSTTIYVNGTLLNSTIFSLDRFWLLLLPWLYNSSGAIAFNESYLNETIDVRDTNTEKQADGIYLYNDSTTIYLNSTLLNQTINNLAGDTQKNASGPYLYNDSITIYLNSTLLNETIDSRDTNTEKGGADPYLYNDSSLIYLNETKLNESIIEISDIMAYEIIQNITVSGGTGATVFSKIDYLITQITVIPPSTPAIYRFEALEGSDGDYIDRGRIPHLNIWNIYKSHSINDTVNTSITLATVDGNYSVRIKYVDNVIQV